MNRVMKNIIYIFAIAFPYFLLDTSYAFADLTIERKVTIAITDVINRKEKINRIEVVKIRGNTVKIEDKTFGTIFIIRGDKKLAWQINTLNGTYSEVSFAEILEQKKKVINEIKSAKKIVEGSEEATILDKIITDLGDIPTSATVEVTEDKEVEDVLGYKCRHRTISLDGRIIIDGWFADEVDGSVNYLKTLVQIGSLPSVLEERLSQLKGTMLKGDIRYTLFTDRITATETVSSLSTEEIKSDEFNLPSGLRKVTFDDFEDTISPNKQTK